MVTELGTQLCLWLKPGKGGPSSAQLMSSPRDDGQELPGPSAAELPSDDMYNPTVTCMVAGC